MTMEQALRQASWEAAAAKMLERHVLMRPRTDDELHGLIAHLWDITIPRIQTCEDHVAPFTALADAYFARSPISVWHASRGFGGKSFCLAVLSLTEMVTKGAEVIVLGGSGLQSERVVAYKDQLFSAVNAPHSMITSRDAKMSLKLDNGGELHALTASSRSVRGAHPQRLRIDEADEMDLGLFDAAMGQTMTKAGVSKQTAISSTWQYPDATMAEVLRRADEKGWPVHRWCWRETSNEADGWLNAAEVESKRLEVPEAMFRAEYDLQEPGFDDPAFQLDRLEAVVDDREPAIGSLTGAPGELVTFETSPQRFVTAADWARKKDWTVNVAFTMAAPAQLVAFRRDQRRPWPAMVASFDDLHARFPGIQTHDETGIGDVVGDYLADRSEGFMMVGRERAKLFQDYILAIEHGRLRLPRIAPLIDAHRWCRTDDLFGSGHPPDEVVACALAWRIVNRYQRTSNVAVSNPATKAVRLPGR